MGMKMIGNANTENFVRGNASLIAEHLEENPDGATSRYHRVYKCKDCDKEYDSFQALGGHRASHRKLMKETGAHCSGLQFLEESGPKLHECRICGKGFAIGQALGGHMRKHREMKLDTGQKDSLHNNANAKIWNTTVVSCNPDSSSVTSVSNGKVVFKYDLNLLPHENEFINAYWGSIKKRRYF
ncbi:Zinc finger, C2H2 [Cynara cardunculus var. scolymus]|uniref:Zinc finger, C2H2 n=1 Tax=Cynara cardunculus var. scolymus TaxID=59895 RepID=A0A103YL28_CYNCS|nr:Zinc finger, C2H2 [Cynara cardunculus var. scolymus]